MKDFPDDLRQQLEAHGQGHLLLGWASLSEETQREFLNQLASLNLAELASLYQRRNEPHAALPSRDRIRPLAVLPAGSTAAAKPTGEVALRAGQVAALVVAGGQGSRLGFESPKGLFPIGPVSGASLFQIHAEKVLALSRRYGRPMPFLVMTSPATHAETEAYFEQNLFFGLKPDQVHFFQQGTMPALDLATGQLLLEQPGQLFLSPNGHGGTLTALADTGLLALLKDQGVRHLFYFQVDNPLVSIADPEFVGQHIESQAEVSSKVVFKEVPEEKVGILAEIDGRCSIIEYSDMPAEMIQERTATGELAFRAGNPAIHLFSVPFLERVTSGATRLGFHVARKKVPYSDPTTGQKVTPTAENALKFELFVFDALPLADRWLAVQTRREDEFAPVKNATGTDSPASSKRLQIERAHRWLARAGVVVPGELPVEISPLFALDEDELVAKSPLDLTMSEPIHLR